MTTTPLTKALAMMAEMFPNPVMTATRMGVYRYALADLSPSEVERATKHFLAHPTRQFFPTSGEIREAARPEPTLVSVSPLFSDVEYAVLLKRATLSSIEAAFGPAARAAVVACGGLAVFRTLDLNNNRPHVLKLFAAAMIECHRNPERAQFGALPQPVAQLVKDTSTKLKLVGKGES